MINNPDQYNQIETSELAQLIHQAALGPHLSEEALSQICNATKHFDFSGLCTNLIRLEKAKIFMGAKHQAKLIAVIAFPFGNIPGDLKKQEAEWAANQGANELDVVPNFFALQQGEANKFAEELAEICEIGLPVRAILDSNYLSKEKLSLAISASIDAGVSGVISGNGFGQPISKEIIKEMSKLVKGQCELKAVGGIKTLSHATEVLQAGATQIGTSFGMELMQEIRRGHKD
ncbi:deoxyribose-phosphate aldolase [Prochlorococcus sp. MIT 1223]|uniref:deoxyribose-phosphate aldolase n=1 Tax=Prochlorococcus sp. MIT 1223 TaxID=3096217 RepID=UPI002A764BB8|nr:deoxyribose-phosphate aldolase [Prochlorococcus sp. MIT 1223]